jgi:hypothetical protein
MHRVINLQSTGYNDTTVGSHKTELKSIVDGYSDNLHSSEVNDGHDENGNPTLAVNADFNSATAANSCHADIKTYIQNNADDFSFARTRVHDCMHAADKNEPCNIGDVWEL